jgi:RNA-directed DNA polymerase
LVNTDELGFILYEAEHRVLEIQSKLHRWARDAPHRRFDDLFNLVTDPAFLMVAWDRVRHNKGAKTAGVDGRSAYYVQRSDPNTFGANMPRPGVSYPWAVSSSQISS